MSTDSQQVNVMYVGRKPFAVDNVAHSGQTWEGRGDLKPVSPKQARLLLNHPSQWWLEGPLPSLEEVDARVTEFFAGRFIPDEVTLPTSVEDMDADELRAYAQAEYGQTLPARMDERALREEIAALELAAQAEGGANATVAKPRPRPRQPVEAKPAKAEKAKPAAKKLPKIDVAKAGKDRLDQYARTHFGVEIDQRHDLKKIRAQVSRLIAEHAR